MSPRHKRLIGDILLTLAFAGSAVLFMHWLAGCAAQSGGVREDTLARIDTIGAAVHQVRNDVAANRDAITTTGVSGWTLFAAFAAYLVASKTANVLHDRLRRKH